MVTDTVDPPPAPPRCNMIHIITGTRCTNEATGTSTCSVKTDCVFEPAYDENGAEICQDHRDPSPDCCICRERIIHAARLSLTEKIDCSHPPLSMDYTCRRCGALVKTSADPFALSEAALLDQIQHLQLGTRCYAKILAVLNMGYAIQAADDPKDGFEIFELRDWREGPTPKSEGAWVDLETELDRILL